MTVIRITCRTALELNRRPIVALSFHVDYWNDLGWVDPFSSARWSERQRRYARLLGEDSVYTPEVVVAGSAAMVGSQRRRVVEAIAHAPKQIDIVASANWSDDHVEISATAPADGDVWVAIWHDAAITHVTRGENSGSDLRGDRVVQTLELVARAGQRTTTKVALAPAWRTGSLGAVVFAQRANGSVIGAHVSSRGRL